MTISVSDTAFLDRALTGVSRTFALTIPQLPETLRPAIGNAYLLCRLADTIEDAAALAPDEKQARFDLLVAALENPDAADDLGAALEGKLTSATAAEHALATDPRRVFAIFHGLPPEQQVPVRRCVTIMTAGMARFERLKSPEGLASTEEFHDYCYRVAGVVGEMLTELFALDVPVITRDRAAMRERAVAFGQGLQMTNILKDVWDDRARGVCWLPRDTFARHECALTADAAWHRDPAFRDGVLELVAAAHGHLQQAMAYTLAVPRDQPGIRRFCAWAVCMALYTLRNIGKAPDFSAADQVKISRWRVRAVVAECSVSVRHDALLQATFARAARGLPAPRDCHPSLITTVEETPWTRTP